MQFPELCFILMLPDESKGVVISMWNEVEEAAEERRN
jgi:hypothetical protein